MSAPSVGERLLELLEQAGVEVVFGIAGTHTIALLGAFERRGRPRFVSARNEQGAAYMATGYARATGKPGVVVTSTGPGALNAFAGMAEAKYSSLPLFHITSVFDFGPFSGGVHETPAQSSLLQAVGVGAWRAETEAIDAAFWRAWQRCVSAPKGPVSLELNGRLWNKPAKTDEGARAAAAATYRPPRGDLGALIEETKAAKAPILYVGGGALLSGAREQVVQLAERLGAPIVTSTQGKSVADWSHPLYVGPWGQDAPVRELFKACDLAIVIGSKLSSLATLHWQLPLPAKSYRVDPAAEVHGRYPQLVPLKLDAREACEALLQAVPAKKTAAQDGVRDVKERVVAAAKQRAPTEWGFVEAITRSLPPDAGFALDMNKASFWFMKYVAVGRLGVHSFSSYLCMGSGVPAAVGLAESGRRVLVSVGDGGFQMGLSELGVIAERRYPIAILVFNDGKYGLLRDNGLSEKVRGARELGIVLKNPDFAKFAAAFDLGYARVRSGDELEPHLRRIEQPMILETNCDFSCNW